MRLTPPDDGVDSAFMLNLLALLQLLSIALLRLFNCRLLPQHLSLFLCLFLALLGDLAVDVLLPVLVAIVEVTHRARLLQHAAEVLRGIH